MNTLSRRISKIETAASNGAPIVVKLPIDCSDDEAERLVAEARIAAGDVAGKREVLTICRVIV